MINYSLSILFAFFALLAVVVYLSYKFGKRSQKLGAYIIVVLVAVFYGLRNFSVGVDTKEYIARFENGVVTDDYLFSYMGIILKQLGVTPTIYLFIIALLTSVLLLRSIKNFSGSYAKAGTFLALIAILPYGIMAYVNVARQGLAVAIILYGLSLVFVNKKALGYFGSLISFFIHKTTALIYVLSLLMSYVMKKRRGILFLSVFTVLAAIIVGYIPTIISAFNQESADKFIAFSANDTSESPYLIYIKMAWAAIHIGILHKLNKSKKLPKELYHFCIAIFAISIILISNPLASSRILLTMDIALPVLYAAYPGRKNRLYIVGLALLCLYALLSPFIFNLYAVNFGW